MQAMQGSTWRIQTCDRGGKRRFRRPCDLTIGAVTLVVGLGFSNGAAGQCEPVEAAKLTADDGADDDRFGASVCFWGDRAVIGAYLDDDNGDRSGSAYIFERQDGVWTQVAKLTADDAAPRDWFGTPVSISGDTAVIAAIRDGDNGDSSGSAYVFERQDGMWTQTAKLTADDGAEDDWFGCSNGIAGDTAVIGAYQASSAYVFERQDGVWTQTAKLTVDDGAKDDLFGVAVSVWSDMAVIGAARDDDNGHYSGSAYVFERQDGVWTQTAKLTADDGEEDDHFGGFVSVWGNTAVIGADRDDDNGLNAGSAYVFERQDGVWTQTAKLTADDGAARDQFGAVSISGDTAVIGANRDDDDGNASGSAYMFVRRDGVWTQTAKLTAHDGAEGDTFGNSVSVWGNMAFIGSSGNDDNGSAYVFDLGSPDLDGNGTVDTGDVVTVIARWGESGGREDLDHSGTVGFGDILVVLGAWGPCE